MENIEFDSLEEIYLRVRPALRSKVKMLKKEGFGLITEKDIWEYMYDERWTKEKELELCDVVDDILHVDSLLINEYYKKKHTKKDDDELDLPKLKD